MSVTRHEVILWAEDLAIAVRKRGGDATPYGQRSIAACEFIVRALRDPEPEPSPSVPGDVEAALLAKWEHEAAKYDEAPITPGRKQAAEMLRSCARELSAALARLQTPGVQP